MIHINEDWPEAMKVYSQRLIELFKMPIPGWSQSGNRLSVRYSKGNHSFKDSKYFLDPKNQSFSHLTTYKGFFGIINSGVFRLYNLHTSNDPNELFSLNGIQTYGNATEKLKSLIYTFSFCKASKVANPIMWRTYGQVSLNFEIVNDPLAWQYYRISPMHYGDSEFVPKYVALLDEMHERFPQWHFDPDLESILSLLAFHKETTHQHEEEIRLLYIPFMFDDKSEAQFDFRVSDVRTGITKFVELPLLATDEQRGIPSSARRHSTERNDDIPLVKITSIEFGDNEPLFDQRQLDKIRHELEYYLTARFGYQIEVKGTLFNTEVKS